MGDGHGHQEEWTQADVANAEHLVC
jgi:hypothetical protein